MKKLTLKKAVVYTLISGLDDPEWYDADADKYELIAEPMVGVDNGCFTSEIVIKEKSTGDFYMAEVTQAIEDFWPNNIWPDEIEFVEAVPYQKTAYKQKES